MYYLFKEHGTAMMFKIPFESKMVANVSGNKFSKIFICSNKRDITHLLSKTLCLSHRQAETLIPVQSKDGVVFTFIIIVDSIYFDHMWKELQQAVKTKSFITKMKSIYNITDQVSVETTKLRKWTLGSTNNSSKQQQSKLASMIDIESNLQV